MMNGVSRIVSILMMLAFLVGFVANACAEAVYEDYDQDMLGTSYVDAYANEQGHNIWATDEATYPNLTDWLSPTEYTQYFWWEKTNSGKAINGNAFEGRDADSPPELTMVVTGLDPVKTYDIYAVYWAKNPAKISVSWWYTFAALKGNPLIECSYSTADNLFFDDGGNGVQGGEKKLGTVSGVTEFSVIVQPPTPVASIDHRAWFDGVSYAESAVPEPSTWVLLAVGLVTLAIGRKRR
ncbi:MAG: PEP-CTERM sorting domain-containing protein [Pirellulales bacterium]|nr:PEP-CTERM sorting domain-containing protein [Pirellulales bacterium]